MKTSLAIKHGDYWLKVASSTGGKAGKGLNRTSTIQVIQEVEGGRIIKRMFRFNTNDIQSRLTATLKAEKWIADNPLPVSPTP